MVGECANAQDQHDQAVVLNLADETAGGPLLRFLHGRVLSDSGVSLNLLHFCRSYRAASRSALVLAASENPKGPPWQKPQQWATPGTI
jgi:hypothetical protein